jgi:hypothetical protein
VNTRVVVSFSTPFPVDQLGTFSAAIEITEAAPSEGGILFWRTPVDACTIAVAGTGRCSQPATPEPGTVAAPISIGDFAFNSE